MALTTLITFYERNNKKKQNNKSNNSEFGTGLSLYYTYKMRSPGDNKNLMRISIHVPKSQIPYQFDQKAIRTKK